MKTGTTKPNTHTQQLIIQKKSIKAQLQALVGISNDDWLEMLFEYGMQFLENNYSDIEEVRSISQDSTSKFWAYWMDEWLNDDAKIIEMLLHTVSYGYNDYAKDKLLLTQKIQKNEETQH